MDGEDLLEDATSCQFRDCEERGGKDDERNGCRAPSTFDLSLSWQRQNWTVTRELPQWQNIRDYLRAIKKLTHSLTPSHPTLRTTALDLGLRTGLYHQSSGTAFSMTIPLLAGGYTVCGRGGEETFE